MLSNSWLGLTTRDTTPLGPEQTPHEQEINLLTTEEPVDAKTRQQEDLKGGVKEGTERL